MLKGIRLRAKDETNSPIDLTLGTFKQTAATLRLQIRKNNLKTAAEAWRHLILHSKDARLYQALYVLPA